jgi:serine/threonine protein kinase
VQLSDFEMIRVLGKGRAGKVFLVRRKISTHVYALKAITKRHVLAHQELQHTLTEQAVLRRMAVEGTDPFVVKLLWSFHDKENLFLVMVRLTSIQTNIPKCLTPTCIVTGLPSWRRSCYTAGALGPPGA